MNMPMDNGVTPGDVSFGNKYGDRMEEVFGAVKDGAHTRTEIIAAVTVPENQIDTYLRRLVLARWLYRPRRGEYAVATAEVRFMVEDYDTGRRAKNVSPPTDRDAEILTEWRAGKAAPGLAKKRPAVKPKRQDGLNCIDITTPEGV